MSSETIEEWAARVAQLADELEWQAFNGDYLPEYADKDAAPEWFAEYVADYDRKRAALLAYRAKVAADVAVLSWGGALRCLRKSCAGTMGRYNEGNRRMLETRGLLDGLVVTPFGREVARMLEADHG